MTTGSWPLRKSLVLLAMVMSLGIWADSDAGTRPRFGVKLGVSDADQTWGYSNFIGRVDRDRRKGFAFGAFADWSLVPFLQLRPEVLYVQKGSELKVRQSSYSNMYAGTIIYKDRIDYLSLVATVKLQISQGLLGLYLIGGPRLDLKLSANSDLPGPDIQAILDSYHSNVPGVTLGAGIQYALGPLGPLLVEFRYDRDSREAAKYVGSEAVLKIDNKAYLVLVGFVF